MEQQPLEPAVTTSDQLRGRELVQWALDTGESVVPELNDTQRRYFQAVARSAGVEWPEEFFESDVRRLMDNRLGR